MLCTELGLYTKLGLPWNCRPTYQEN